PPARGPGAVRPASRAGPDLPRPRQVPPVPVRAERGGRRPRGGGRPAEEGVVTPHPGAGRPGAPAGRPVPPGARARPLGPAGRQRPGPDRRRGPGPEQAGRGRPGRVPEPRAPEARPRLRDLGAARVAAVREVPEDRRRPRNGARAAPLTGLPRGATPMKLRITEDARSFETELTAPVELGRQRDDEPGPFSVRTEGDRVPRVVIAWNPEVADFSREHVQLRPLSGGRVRVTNLSTKFDVPLPVGDAPLPPGRAAELTPPFSLALKGRTVSVGDAE